MQENLPPMSRPSRCRIPCADSGGDFAVGQIVFRQPLASPTGTDFGLVLPAYDYVMKASHAFNVLDARGAISVSERQKYIGRVRGLAKLCAVGYDALRYRLGLPLCPREERETWLTARQEAMDAENQKKAKSQAEVR